MKSISIFINTELLSKENEKILEEILKQGIIDNTDVELIVKHHKISDLLTTEVLAKYDEVLYNIKQFNLLNWPKKQGAKETFIRIFDNNLEKLNEIIFNHGVISINDIPEIGNIFNYCKDFKQEAYDIAELTTPNGNTASGKFEILLKLILKEGYTDKHGDVSIIGSLGGMEVKCNSRSGKNSNSGGRPFGQGSNYTKPWRIYQWLNKYLLNLSDDTDLANNCIYFQTTKGCNEFLNKCEENKLKTNVIVETIVDAICYQYEFLSIKDKSIKDSKFNYKKYKAIKDAAKKFIGTNKLTDNIITSLVECCQLCCYSIVEGFNYFIMPYIDLRMNNITDDSGKYILIKNCQSIKSKLYNFNYLTTYIKFSHLGPSTDSRKLAGEMRLNIDKIQINND